MTVLVACERSGHVRDALLARGIEAISCDLEPSRAPGPHIVGDVRDLISPDWTGARWTALIGFPPCTFLANSGVSWMHTRIERWAEMLAAAQLFRDLLCGHRIPLVALENPRWHSWAAQAVGVRHSQEVQPWWFGTPRTKATRLWLRGLPPLLGTRAPAEPITRNWTDSLNSGQKELREQTPVEMAEAMADQWHLWLAAK